MRWCLAALIGSFFFASVIRVGAGFPQNDWQVYSDKTFRVTLRFPKEWKQVRGDGSVRFEGRDGFVYLTAEEGDTPESACRGSAKHHLQPYGSRPVIRSMRIQGRKACLVWPSSDQGAPWIAELDVAYPRPVEIDGDRWGLFLLYADKDHILQIIRTLRFLSSNPRGGAETPR